MNFKEWLLLMEHSSGSRGKIGLYPPLYTQVYNYPPADIINWSADAITYMDPEDLKYRFLYTPFFTPVIRKTIGNYGKQAQS